MTQRLILSITAPTKNNLLRPGKDLGLGELPLVTAARQVIDTVFDSATR